MKYVAIILAGAAGEPAEALGGKTPLEAATLPNLTRLAAAGRVGCAYTLPEDLPPAPEVAAMSILGYSPLEFPVGRAALEALGAGVQLRAGEWVLRVSFVTMGEVEEEAGLLVDASPEGLTEREARVLLTDLLGHWRATQPQLVGGLSIAPGTGKRLMLVDGSGASYQKVMTSPPIAAWQEAVKDHWPSGGAEGTRLRRLMESSQAFLSRHEVNLARAEQGLRPANMAWLWGQGTAVTLPPLKERLGVRGLMFSGDEAVGGLAVAAGLDRQPVFCGLDGDELGLDALAEAVSDGLRRADLVCCYLEEPLHASLRGDPHEKVAVLEQVDARLIGPLIRDLDESYGDPAADAGAEGWRALVISDVTASSERRQVLGGPVPFVMAGAWVRSVLERPFTEESAAASDLQINPGHELMEYFLRGGLASVRARAR
ncbi:MAG TPA: hypothetical protein VD997_14245 [Phycisphaerales bacterium]|nr:hypothetical protein [Phycisphaerales bacterium]